MLFIYLVLFTGIPSVLQDPSNSSMLVNETLNVACSFTAKPEANISWIRGTSDIPDMSPINVTFINTDDGPYTITTSKMTWRTSVLDERRTVSDIYKCKAVNSVGMQTSQIMNLDIQCE